MYGFENSDLGWRDRTKHNTAARIFADPDSSTILRCRVTHNHQLRIDWLVTRQS